MRAESGLLGAILSGETEVLPAAVQRLINHAPESFDDQRYGVVAVAIRSVQAKKAPLHVTTLLAEMNGVLEQIGGTQFISAITSDALPMSVAEYEALGLWDAYNGRRAVSLLRESSETLSRSPDLRKSVLTHVSAASQEIIQGDLPPKSSLSILSFEQIAALPTHDSDIIMGDGLLVRGQPLVIAAQGGAGKSRIINQLAATVTFAAYHPEIPNRFLNFDLPSQPNPPRWLILQTENSVRRLKQERERLINFFGTDAYRLFEKQVHILTPLNPDDVMMGLENPATIANLQQAIGDLNPDIIAFDPLYSFTDGDLNKDVDMRAVCLNIGRLARHGNPRRGYIVSHHALTGRSGIEKSMGYDRASFSRNSKVLFNWTRAQINIVPASEENNDSLIVSCGKCSDGREFDPFAIRLNPETLIYECDPTVDVLQWRSDLSQGANPKPPAITPKEVRDLCKPLSSKADLARAIRDHSGCTRETAYRHIRIALQKRAISSKDDLCSPA